MAIDTPFPPLEPQHPQHLGKYETKLRSDPQQSRNMRHNSPRNKRDLERIQGLDDRAANTGFS
jgi:hypothetical protein